MENQRLSFTAIMRRLLPFARPYRRYVITSLALTIVGAVAAQVDPFVLRYLVDQVTALSQEGVQFVEGLPILILAGGILLVKQVVILVVDLGQGYLGETLKTNLSADLSNVAYSHALKLGIPFFETRGNEPGRMIQRIDRGVEGLSKVMKNVLVDMLPLFANAVLGLIIMYSVNVWVGMLASFIVPVYFTLSLRQAKEQEGVRVGIQDLKEVRTSAMLNALLSVKVIKSFVREKFEIDKHHNLNTSLATSEIKHHQTNRLYDALKFFSEDLGSTAIIIFTSYLILNGQMSVGAILLHLALYRNITAPIRHLHRIYDEHNEAITFAYGYFSLLDTPTTETLEPGAQYRGSIRGDFTVEDLNFSYTPGRRVLHDVKMTLKSGETTALVGLSGAGKTTIASLLVRFYEPESGHITLDGKDLRDYPLHTLREQIGVVLQESHIFSGSIADNIRYGNLDASVADIERAATRAQLHTFVQTLPQGYDSPASELAGGQKQRVSLARIFLKDPPVLILDEPTASLDAITTEQIKLALNEARQGRTTLIISHNISQIVNADQIYVVKDGRVIEAGTHETLYAQDGHYADIIDSNIENLSLKKLMRTMGEQ